MSKVTVEIESQINELYAKTRVLQEFTNSSSNPIELKIYLYKKKRYSFRFFQCKNR